MLNLSYSSPHQTSFNPILDTNTIRDIQKINKIICRLIKYQDQAPYDLPALRWNLKNLSRGLNPPKSAKTRFKFSAGLNLKTFDTILSGTNHI